MRTALAVALLACACFMLSAAGTGAASSAMRIVAATPRLPHAARVLGAVRADATISGAVVLRPRSEAALTRFIAAVTDKHSPLFRHYLAPGQFAARFGPAPTSIAAVIARLRADGLAVTVAPNGMLVHFRGSAEKVEHAFSVGLDRIRLADGSIGRARTAPIRLPATIAGLVTSVVGLDNVLRLQPAGIVTRAAKPKPASRSHAAALTATFPHPAGSPAPCADARSAASEFGGLTDDQIAHAYGAFGLYGASDVGAGQRIAVFELEPFAASDIEAFDTCYFGATAATAMAGRLTTIPIDGGQPDGAGVGESLLDIQDISALAPGAYIDVYEAPNTTFGVLDEYAAIVNDGDSIVSSSWGLCEQAVQQGEPGVLEAENLLFQQAAAQGQSVFSASGDNGSDTCNAFYEPDPTGLILSQNDPSSQPYVVGVGGTSIDSATQPALEHVWNDGIFWGAGGGGISESWPMPAWQLSSLVPGLRNAATIDAANSFEAGDLDQPGYAFCQTDNPAGANQAACREVPDVSAQADEFTGGITVYAEKFGGWTTSGGTSSAAPIWAALLAVVNESATCQSNVATENGVGFVSPLLYSVASNPAAYAASFNDITAGNNDPYGFSGLFPATTGYDMASGLGSPQLTQPGNGAGLAYYLCTAAASGPRPTVTDIADNVAFTSASSTNVTITGTNFGSNASPAVAAVQVGDYVLPPADFHVDGATSISATFPAAAKVLPPQAATDGAGRVQVVVTLNDGESSALSPGSAFTYVDNNGANAIPSVTSVGPYGGIQAGGNTVDIYGSGFTGATGVEFGGVAATDFTVLHDWEIAATVPPYAGGTTDCAEDGSSYGTGEDATNDVCQVQVVVTGTHGQSQEATILPLYEGDASYNPSGIIPPAPGTEPAPASTEFDYFPTPTITSISTDDGPFWLASEDGNSVITIKGTGLNLAGLEWVDFGDPSLADSQNFDLVTVTGTEIQIVAPPLEAYTVGAFTVPVTVRTIAGQSGSVDATYAGVPTVAGVTATAGPTAGEPAGPATGGTPIDVTGEGFADQVVGIAFVDSLSPFSLGTQYNVTAHSDSDLTSTTVPQNPALVDVLVCTVTSCSSPEDGSAEFLLYPPGDPKIDSITPAKGPASGGRKVTITGENLGCVTGVYFGRVAAKKVSNARALLDCGSTTKVKVTVPPGKSGKSVRVSLTTVESVLTGFGATKDTVHFRYTHPVPQTLTVKHLLVIPNGGRGTVTSSPAGLHCGGRCSHHFPYKSVVKLTATPAHGSFFAGWVGACHGKGTCRVRMNSAKVVGARFIKRSR